MATTPRVLILGGYGTTGATLAELLLEHSGAHIVLAGRTPSRAEALAAELGARYADKVTARRADAADPVSLASAFAGVDLVAVAASSTVHAGTVAQAALDAGCDYYDLQLSVGDKIATLEGLRGRIVADGRCFITDGGIHPGLSAVLVRALLPVFDSLERADVAGLMRVDWNAYGFSTDTIHEFASEMADYRVEALVDGEWGQVPWKAAMKEFDFGPAFGRERCSLMYLEEIGRLPALIPELRTCGFYVAGFNPFTNNVMMPLGLAVMKASPGLLGRPYARALTWSLRTFGRPPWGTVWQLEAEGCTADGPAKAGLRVTHPDGYWLTAATAAACLLQYLDGSLRTPGLHLQALAVHPARLLRDLRRLGAGLEGFGVDEQTVLGRV